MPNLDGGHYFFTALIPIDNSGIVDHDGFKSSPVHMVRDALEALPTALQSPASEQIGIQSPFARNARTHFLRLFVIDAAHYNGRDPEDAILESIANVDLLASQPVDRLSVPYLAFVAEFDPAGDAPGPWLEALWHTAEPELRSVFQYGYGFDQVTNAATFATFVMKGQIETTMPFNDYWTIAPPLPSVPSWLFIVPPVLGLLAGALIAGMAGWPWGIAGLAVLALAGGVAGAAVDYWIVMTRGAKPFPTAPNTTLRDILKALYVQRAFADFAAKNQGAPPQALQTAFQAFLAEVKPDDLDGPTQSPGVIR